MYNKKQSEAIFSKEGEIVIVAPPGSGKTLTMVGAIQEFVKDGSNPWTVVITFTNNAANELKERLGFSSLEISTIHSWSYRELVSLSQQYGFRVRLLEETQIKEIIKPYMRDYSVSQNSIEYVYQHVMGNVNPDLWQSLKRKYDAIKDRYIAYKRKMHLYDFTDLPLYLRHKLEEHNEYIILDGLFVDEFQDVDPDQLAIFNRVKAKKKFFIGDPDQCQPAGTMVTLNDGSKKPIEKVQKGDRVVSYFPSESYISGTKRSKGFEVLETSSRKFVNDYLIEVETENGKTSKYTPNHKVFAAIRSDNEFNHLVYLMKNNKGRFRIGTSQFYAQYGGQKMSTFRHKLMSEKYEEGWILGVYRTEKEARVFENKYSYQFGIPQVTFQLKKSMYTEEDIDLIYSEINSQENALRLLNHLKLDIELPFLSKGDRMDFRRDAFRKFYAINLIPEIMSMLTHKNGEPATAGRNKEPSKLVKVSKDFIEKPIEVYSLKIDEHETYIADDIVTHNSIYIFRGATEEIFSELPGHTFHELDTNYRSYQEILNFAYDFKNQAPARVGEVSFTNTTSHGVKASRGKGAVIIHEKRGVAIRYEDGFEFMQNLEETVLNELNKHSYQFLCRTNREVRELQELGIHAASTIHKAKGLEYDNVAVIDFGMESDEDINVAFVALTRAKNRLMVISIRDYLKKSVKMAF